MTFTSLWNPVIKYYLCVVLKDQSHRNLGLFSLIMISAHYVVINFSFSWIFYEEMDLEYLEYLVHNGGLFGGKRVVIVVGNL